MRRVGLRIGLAWLLWSIGLHASAQGPSVRVYVAGDACQRAALLRQQLTPLLAVDVELRFEGGEPTELAPGQARVRDRGDSYSVYTRDLAREIDDPLRDCLERARVAAVFIALNVKPAPKPVPEPEPEPEFEPEPEPEPESEPESDRVGFGVMLFGGGAYASELDRIAPGAGAGAWVAHRGWRFVLSAAVLASAELELASSETLTGGAVDLMRMPFNLTAGYALRAGPVEVGPALGLAFDLLRLEGVGVEDPQTELRANTGFLVAGDLQVRILPQLSGVVRVGMSWFPRAYDLSVDRAGRLGRTPRLWFSATAGFGWQI